MAVVAGNADQVRIGPGVSSVAPFGTATPTTIDGTPNAAFRQLGFTTEGSNVTYSQTSDQVVVAERLRGIKSIITAVDMSWDTTLAQFSPRNLQLATNAPDSAIAVTANEVVFTWPKAGGTNRVTILWQADDDLERTVLTKALAGGDISIPRRKGVDPAAVGVTFNIEENSSLDTTINAVTEKRDAYHIWDISLTPEEES